MIQYLQYNINEEEFFFQPSPGQEEKTELLATGHKQARNKVFIAFILDTPFPNLPNDLDPYKEPGLAVGTV